MRHIQVHRLHSPSSLHPHHHHRVTKTNRTLEDPSRPPSPTRAPQPLQPMPGACGFPGFPAPEEPGNGPFCSGIPQIYSGSSSIYCIATSLCDSFLPTSWSNFYFLLGRKTASAFFPVYHSGINFKCSVPQALSSLQKPSYCNQPSCLSLLKFQETL